MDDETPRLRMLLEELHGELSRLPPDGVDDARRSRLLDLQVDIERLLARKEAAGGSPDSGVLVVPHEERRHLQNRLQELAAGFEIAHPQFASALEQTMNALSNMGL